VSFDLAHRLVSEEEGRIAHVYQDSLGFWTIGVGALVDARKGGALCDEAIDAQLEHDLKVARERASKLAGFDRCNEARQAALISMCFQLGSLATWSNFRNALAAGDYSAAADAGLDSLWARQTPARAKRQMQILRTGEWL
jgi:lysozyme